LLKLKTIAEYQQLMNGCLELFNSGCDKKRMHKTRFALFIFMLALWTDCSFGMQANVITTVAGNGQNGFGGDGGPASEAMLNLPGSVTVDSKGNIYIADWRNQRIRKISAETGIITTVAGNGQQGFSGDGGPAIAASLDLMFIDLVGGHPWISSAGGIAVDDAGNVYIADTNNHRVRKVDLNGVITTVVGGGVLSYLSDPSGLAIDHDGSIYIAENDRGRYYGPGVVLKVSPDGTVSEVACCFWQAKGVAVDQSGNIYVADSFFGYDGMIFKVDPSKKIERSGGVTYGNVQPLGGPDFSCCFVGNPWSVPWSLAVDTSGDIVVAEAGSHLIRKVSLNNELSLVAGVCCRNATDDIPIYAVNNNPGGYSGDGGPALRAALASPHGVAVDRAGNIYIADTGNNRIRMIAPVDPTITLDSTRYCIGAPWSLGIATSVSGAWIRLIGTSGGRPWEVSNWRRTGFNGSVIETGAFGLGDVGDHTLSVAIDGKLSNSVSFNVSTCQIQ
jgi:sugar lactone lactonase YvrE